MASPAVTNTFANSTTADATQVNQNFTDLINAMSDGLKDFTINALTCNGAVTLKGAVGLGDSTVDDITFTGSLASNIPIKTDNTYSIGSSTIGLAGLYLGNTSKTVKLAAPASIGTSFTFTFPTSMGTSTYLLQTDGSTQTSWVPILRGPDFATNFSLSTSAAASALTVTLKSGDGTSLSSSNPFDLVFRSATATTGTMTNVRTTGDLSITISSGASLGLTASVNQYVHVYALNNSGTVELAVAGNRCFDEGALYTTTAMTGSATDGFTLYSTSGRASVPVRYLGRLKVNVASFWASAASSVELLPADTRQLPRSEVTVDSGNGRGSTNTKFRRFSNTRKSVGTAITYADSATAGASFTINEPGVYACRYHDVGSGGSVTVGILVNSSTGTTDPHDHTYAQGLRGLGVHTTANYANCAWTGFLNTGDVVRAGCTTGVDSTTQTSMFTIVKVSN